MTRRFPLLRGGGRVSRFGPLPKWVRHDEVVQTRLGDGPKISVHSGDWIGATVLFTGYHDRRLSVMLRRVLRPGDTFVDIGANYGVYALAAAKHVGASGTVCAIEPQPDLAAMLESSKTANGFDQLRVEAMALGTFDGQAELTIPENNRGGGTLLDAPAGLPRVQVPVRHAGRFLEALPDTPRMIKLDVEGHEADLLGASADALADRPPPVLAFESLPIPTPAPERPAFRTLTQLGFEVYLVSPSPWRFGLLPLSSEGQVTDRWPPSHDYVALHRDAADVALGRALRVPAQA